MSWQGFVFAGLALVVVGGVAWYERSRPSARLVALVAALAAMAIAGRLALAPAPNVVATTDIVLLTGYSLGAAPGFAVGALAAPVSNIWLGQGPWTAWQMAGWGLVGIGGAALAMVTRRRLGRLGIAAACGAAAFAYGALLDLSVMVSYGGEQSLDRYLALSARGLPFNVAHAAGNVALALIAGPALVRMISRYRTRLQFTWRPAGALPLLAAALCAAALVAPDAHAGPADARAWLERARNGDGGYAATPGQRSSAKMTVWAMLGLEAAGRNPLDVGPRGSTPVDYLRSRASRLRRDIGDLELAILALEGAGVDSRSFAGQDLAAQLMRLQGRDGSFGGQVNLTAYAILALRAAGVSSGIGKAGDWLRSAGNGDGGWGSNASARSDPDSTGSAIQGLRLAGGGGGRGVAYLRRTQKREGGWGLNESGVTNSQSTAFAVMGLVAAGVDPASVRRNGRSGLGYLARRQAGDGHYAYSAGSHQTPVWVTSQALLASSREALPVERVPRSRGAARPAPDLAPAGEPPGGRRKSSAPAAGKPERREREPGGRQRTESGGEERHEGTGQLRLRRGTLVGSVPARVAARLPGEEADDTATWALAGLGALAGGLGAGFLWYRRRLP